MLRFAPEEAYDSVCFVTYLLYMVVLDSGMHQLQQCLFGPVLFAGSSLRYKLLMSE